MNIAPFPAIDVPIAEEIRRLIPRHELTLVVPTFNERDNVRELLRRVTTALDGVRWEIVFVDDDSPDGTAALVKEIAFSDPRVRCIRRVNRRGLAGACIEGILASSAPFVCVMDADLQHSEDILPRLLASMRTGTCDLAVGSRYMPGGSAEAGFTSARVRLSRLGTDLARRAFKTDLTDPMSGFFMIRRDLFEGIAHRLSPDGFKLLADIVASIDRPLRTTEIAYEFRQRMAGESKLDVRVGLDFIGLLVNRLSRGWLPTRFALFGLVGASGVLVHLAVLKSALALIPGLTFTGAQTWATLAAIATNFLANNATTYRHSRLKGRGLLRGLLTFFGVCAIGAIANVGFAAWVFAAIPVWWLAASAGIVIGFVWNYTLSSLFVWRAPA